MNNYRLQSIYKTSRLLEMGRRSYVSTLLRRDGIGSMNKSSHCKSGFTFVETLVAITVLLVAVVAPMSLAQDGILAARLSQDQIVAFYLGQEGIEMVKNLRDNNRLSNAVGGQLSGAELANCTVSHPESNERGCIIDATRVAAGQFYTERCLGECEAIRLTNTAPFLYSYNTTGTTATKYTREVKVWNPTTDLNEAAVEVTVSWEFGKSGITRTYKVRDYMYNW